MPIISLQTSVGEGGNPLLEKWKKRKRCHQAPCGSSGKERGVKVLVEGQLLADTSGIEQAPGI
jgi:hypothetical protein